MNHADLVTNRWHLAPRRHDAVDAIRSEIKELPQAYRALQWALSGPRPSTVPSTPLSDIAESVTPPDSYHVPLSDNGSSETSPRRSSPRRRRPRSPPQLGSGIHDAHETACNGSGGQGGEWWEDPRVLEWWPCSRKALEGSERAKEWLWNATHCAVCGTG